MKKLFSIILAVSFICSALFLVACKEPTTAELVNGATEKTRNLDTYEADMDLSVLIEAQGMKMDVPIKMKVKSVDSNADYPTNQITMNAEFLGMKLDLAVYVEDGWVYSVSPDGNTKAYMGATGNDGDDTVDGLLRSLPEDLFEECEVVKNEDGSKKVKLNLPTSAFDMLFKDSIGGAFYGSMIESIVGTDTISSDTIKSISLEYNVGKNGYISSFEMDMSLDSDIPINNGVPVPASITLTIQLDYVKIEEGVELSPPAGYLDFPEAS